MTVKEEKQKKKKISLVVFSAITILLLASYVFFVQIKKVDIEMILQNLVKNNINGSLKLEKLSWELEDSRIKLKAADIKLFDTENKIIADLDNLVISLRWRNLLSFSALRHLKSISADSLQLYLERDEQGVWNYEKLKKKSQKDSFSFGVDRADLPHCQISLVDLRHPEASTQFDDLKIKWTKQAFNNVYNVDIDSGDQAKSYIKIYGNLALGSLKQVLRNDLDLTYTVRNLATNNLIPFFDLFDLHLHESYGIKNSSISSTGTIAKSEQNQFKVTGILAFDKRAQRFMGKYSGVILRDTKHGPKLNLVVAIEPLDLPSFIENYALDLPRIYHYPFNLIANKMKVVHAPGLSSVEAKITGPIYEPKVDFNLYLLNKDSKQPNTLKAKFEIKDSNLMIEQLSLPVENSDLQVSGNVRKDLLFDLDLKSNGLALNKLRDLAVGIPFATQYQPILKDSSIFGKASMDLNLHKRKVDRPFKVSGTLDLSDVNFFNTKYPIELSNAAVKLAVLEDILEVSKLSGYLGGEYFEGQGRVVLEPKINQNNIDLKLALPSFDLAKLAQANLLELFGLEQYFQKAEGKLEDLRLDIVDIPLESGRPYLQLIGDINLNKVSINQLENVRGRLNFHENGINIDSLKFRANDARVQLSGRLNKKVTPAELLWDPELELMVNGLDLHASLDSLTEITTQHRVQGVFAEIAEATENGDLSIAQGKLDAHLTWRDYSIWGDFSFQDLAFYHQKLSLPFSSVNGDLSLEENGSLLVNAMDGNFGASPFKLDANFNKLLKSEGDYSKLAYNLNLDAIAVMDELFELLPLSIQKYTSFKGKAPLRLKARGTSIRHDLDLHYQLSDLDEFSYSNWFKLKKDLTASLDAKILVTPKLIASRDFKITLSKAAGDKAVINSFFEIRDYRSKEDINYYTRFSIPTEQNLSFVGPNILTLKDFEILFGPGDFTCNTFGNSETHQTLCNIALANPRILNFGIGDLNINKLSVDLLAFTGKPVGTTIHADSGDWNSVPFADLDFNLNSDEKILTVTNLLAHFGEGKVWTDFDFEYATEKSNFNVRAQALPAHDFAEAIWKLGVEVPEGAIDGTFLGSSKGIEQEDMFYNMDAIANFVVSDGVLSKLKSMQKILSALTALQNLDLNNVMQVLVTYQGGAFDHIVSSIQYDHGKMSSDKLLLKAPQIELNLEGEADYAADQISIQGKGLIPKHSKSILTKLGLGPINLGNALSVLNLGAGDKSNRYFEFSMQGPPSSPEDVAKSATESFKWLD